MLIAEAGAALTMIGTVLLSIIIIGFLIWLLIGPCNLLASFVALCVGIGGPVFTIGFFVVIGYFIYISLTAGG